MQGLCIKLRAHCRGLWQWWGAHLHSSLDSPSPPLSTPLRSCPAEVSLLRASVSSGECRRVGHALIPSGAHVTSPFLQQFHTGAPGLARAAWATSHFLLVLSVSPLLSGPLHSPSKPPSQSFPSSPISECIGSTWGRMSPLCPAPGRSLLQVAVPAPLLASFRGPLLLTHVRASGPLPPGFLPRSPDACLHLHSAPARPPRAPHPAPQLAPCPTSLITQWVSVTHGGPASPPPTSGPGAQ